MVPIAHSYTDYEQPSYVFSSAGGSGVAFALRRGDTAGLGAWDPGSYVPVWRPPPPMPSERPQPLPPLPTEALEGDDDEMAHTWGHVFRGAAADILGGFGGGGATGFAEFPAEIPGGAIGPPVPAAAMPVAGMPSGACDGMVWSGGTPPKGYKVVNHCGMGVLRKVRRRRRRRMLTSSDKADISYIVATTGKGQLAASLIHKSTH